MPQGFEVPRPRVLFEDVPDDVFYALVAFAPTYQRIAAHQRIHDSDWDLLVTFSDSVRATGPYHVLSFGGYEIGGEFAQKPNQTIALNRSATTVARGAYVAATVPLNLRALAQRTVADPAAESAPGDRAMWQGGLVISGMGVVGMLAHLQILEVVQPFVQVGDEGLVHAFAANRIFRQEAASTVWMLPEDTQNIPAWVRAFVEHLRLDEPTRFPRPSAWKTSDRWATSDLVEAIAKVDDVQRRREEAIVAFDLEEAAAAVSLDHARSAAASGAQRLITDDGDSLVEAVQEALHDLGFDVQLMDNHHDLRTGAKLEDLRVSDPTAPGWIALAEVKGYAKGAKASDVAQIVGRPAIAYLKESGSEADRVWHIVNAFRNNDPDDRAQPLSGAEIDLQALVDAPGALIDTRDLFRAQKAAVDDDKREEIRAGLRIAIGRWAFQEVG